MKDVEITNVELAKFLNKSEGTVRRIKLQDPVQYEALVKLYLEEKNKALPLGGDIVMWSTKGGVGKTTLSCELSSFFQVPVIDCDKEICLDGENSYSSHYEKNANADVLSFPWDDPIAISSLPSPAIYDFGGYLSEQRLEFEVAKKARLIIIPIDTDALGVAKAVESYNLIFPYNSNITFVLNRYSDPKDFENIKSSIEKAIGDEVSMLKFKQYQIIPIASRENIPVYKKAQENGLSRHKYQLLIKELNDIFAKISEFTREV